MTGVAELCFRTSKGEMCWVRGSSSRGTPPMLPAQGANIVRIRESTESRKDLEDSSRCAHWLRADWETDKAACWIDTILIVLGCD